MRTTILALLLVACSPASLPTVEHPQPTARWEHPVANVFASTDMAPDCRAAVDSAVTYLRGLGVPMELLWVEEDHPAISLEPPRGVIAVHAGIPAISHAAANTFVWTHGALISRAEVVLGTCDPYIVGHELLHTQGLEDAVDAESLMHFSTEFRRWGLDPDLRDWVSRP